MQDPRKLVSAWFAELRPAPPAARGLRTTTALAQPPGRCAAFPATSHRRRPRRSRPPPRRRPNRCRGGKPNANVPAPSPGILKPCSSPTWNGWRRRRKHLIPMDEKRAETASRYLNSPRRLFALAASHTHTGRRPSAKLPAEASPQRHGAFRFQAPRNFCRRHRPDIWVPAAAVGGRVRPSTVREPGLFFRSSNQWSEAPPGQLDGPLSTAERSADRRVRPQPVVLRTGSRAGAAAWRGALDENPSYPKGKQ